MRWRREAVVYALLLTGWIAVAVWQLVEHRLVTASAKDALRTRVRDVSMSLGAVIRSTRSFELTPRRRLEARLERAALRELARSGGVQSVSLVTPAGAVLARAGEQLDNETLQLPPGTEVWGDASLTVVDLLQLGSERTQTTDLGEQGAPTTPTGTESERRAGDHEDGSVSPPTSRGDEGDVREGRPTRPPPEGSAVSGERSEETDDREPGDRSREDAEPHQDSDEHGEDKRRPPPRTESDAPEQSDGRAEDKRRPPRRSGSDSPESAEVRDDAMALPPLLGKEDMDRVRGSFGPSRFRGPPPHHPREVGAEEFQELSEKYGLHKFVVRISAQTTNDEIRRDLWMRSGFSCAALLAVLGLGLAWHTRERSAGLQLRLVRAGEMNSYLREMNVAAAGLAHETRNPLNVVRGAAQMIARDPELKPQLKGRVESIIEEVDRVSSRLNEFIDYSRPPEAKLAPTKVRDVVDDVHHTLEGDCSEKGIEFELLGPDLLVEADQSLLRQIVFNLFLNAIQAVPVGGRVEFVLSGAGHSEAQIEVRDNGPGVPADAGESIFRPYVSLNETGTGLGLAIVRQFVLAHNWDIECVPADIGAVFRISGMRVVRRASAP